MKRFFTGCVLFVVFLAVLTLSLLVSGVFFDIYVVLLMMIGGLEMSKAVTKKNAKAYDAIILVNILAGYAAFCLVNNFANSGGITAYFGVLFITIISCIIFTIFSRKKTMRNAVSTIFVMAYPLSFMIYMLALNYLLGQFRTAALFFVFAIPSMTDTMAYFVGSTFKGPKLCPSVSPKKTISGAVGGLIGGLICGAVFLLFSTYRIFGFEPIGGSTVSNILHFLVIGFVGSLFVQAGDLIASVVKRSCGIKDFGNILPGHGGVMDRMDGTIIFSVFLYIYLGILAAL